MIRWIRPNLGTATADDVRERRLELRYVDVRHLRDGSGNTTVLVRETINQIVTHLQQGACVVVRCDLGISRSNAVAAGALALYATLPFAEAVREVIQATGEQEIKLEVLAAVEKAVDGPKRHPPSDSILITGGTGFIGQPLTDRLSSRHSVIAPTRAELDLTRGAASLSLLLSDYRISQIIHLANPRNYSTNSAMGEMLVSLKNVIDACIQHQSRLLFVSSWEIYSAYRSQTLLANESLPPNPRGPYGTAKWLCEEMLQQTRSTHSSFDYTVVRLCPVYGLASSRPRFLRRFINQASRGEPLAAYQFLNGFPSLELLHVSDAVAAIVEVAESGVSGAFNIGPGFGVDVTDLAQLIINFTNSSSQVVTQPVADYAPNILLDSVKAHRLLGWRSKASLEAELKKMSTVRTGEANVN